MKIHQIAPIAAVLLSTGSALAANSVVIESRAVRAGATSVTLGVYVTNDVDLEGLVIPLEIREIASGSFVSGNLALSRQNRLLTYLTAYVVDTTLPDKDNATWYKCDGTGFKTRGAPDYVSPDGLFFAAVKGIGQSNLPQGGDGAFPGGTPSLHITFDASAPLDSFIIDTTCVTPDNHLAFYPADGSRQLITPAFTPGVIRCNCPCSCNPVCDGVILNAIDVVRTVNVAFRGAVDISDEGCPVQRTDVNADGVTSVVDVVRTVNIAFRGQPLESGNLIHACIGLLE